MNWPEGFNFYTYSTRKGGIYHEEIPKLHSDSNGDYWTSSGERVNTDEVGEPFQINPAISLARMREIVEGLRPFAALCYMFAKQNGWHDQERPVWQAFQKISGEALEGIDAAFRDEWGYAYGVDFSGLSPDHPDFDKNKQLFDDQVKDTVNDEAADVWIRMGDASVEFNLDTVKHVLLKLMYNNSRGYKHGKRT